MFWILAGLSLKVEEEKDFWFSGRKCHWSTLANGNTRCLGVDGETETCCRLQERERKSVKCLRRMWGARHWHLGCSLPDSGQQKDPLARGAPLEGRLGGWQKSLIQTSSWWNPSTQSCLGTGSSLGALPSCFAWRHACILCCVTSSVRSVAQTAFVTAMASTTCFTFLPRVFPLHGHPASLCDWGKVSKHLLSATSPFSKRVPVIEPAPGCGGDACPPCSACAEMEGRGTGQGGDISPSFLSQMSTGHPPCLQ